MGAILKVWDKDLRGNLAMKLVLGKEDPTSKGSTPAVDERTLGRFLEEAQVTGQQASTRRLNPSLVVPWAGNRPIGDARP